MKMTRTEELQAERKEIRERIAIIEREYNDRIMPELQRKILTNEKHDLEFVQGELKQICYNEYVERSYKEYGKDVRLMPFDIFESHL